MVVFLYVNISTLDISLSNFWQASININIQIDPDKNSVWSYIIPYICLYTAIMYVERSAVWHWNMLATHISHCCVTFGLKKYDKNFMNFWDIPRTDGATYGGRFETWTSHVPVANKYSLYSVLCGQITSSLKKTCYDSRANGQNTWLKQ